MTSRERVIKTLNHQRPDRIPIDLGASTVTGISASMLAQLREALNLKYKPVKIIEPFQMLGEVEEDLMELLGIDVIGLWPYKAMFFGYSQDNWKPWALQDGTKVLIGSGFQWKEDNEGNVYTYPCGDTSAKPCAKLPRGGFYFDSISQFPAVNGDNLNAREDFKDQFQLYSEKELRYFEKISHKLYNNTSYAITINFWESSIGDLGFLFGGSLRSPKGIRNIEEFYSAFLLYPNYIKELFDFQTEMALKNLMLLKQSIGDRAQAIYISGVDLGTQRGPIISPDMYREFFKPYHKKINRWVHDNTSWKVIFHSCGSIVKFLDDFIDVGVDVLNPIQTSAVDMDPKMLKTKYGDKLVFWGGGVDTQSILPFGTPKEVKNDTLEKINIFSTGGGFVFSTIHNIQYNVPIENILAMFQALKEFNNLSYKNSI